MHQVYLVPGFLGFDHIGSLGYFQGVSELLERALAREHGIEVQVIATDTQASASLPRRAHELLQQLREHAGDDVEAIHFVGHSTGGLDVRLLLEADAVLEGERLPDSLRARTRTAVSLATPHFGTPLASIAVQLNLQLLVAAGAARISRLPLLPDAASLRALPFGTSRVFDWLAGVLGGSRDVFEYLNEIAWDQGALLQLTPAGTHLFQASVQDRPPVRHVCFATAAPPPRFPHSDLLYGWAWDLSSRHDEVFPCASLDRKLLRRIESRFHLRLDSRANDAMVPTLSQLHGELGGVVLADHLDVVGLFRRRDVEEKGWQPSWLCSGAAFDERRFEKLWRGIAAQLAVAPGSAGPPPQIIC